MLSSADLDPDPRSPGQVLRTPMNAFNRLSCHCILVYVPVPQLNQSCFPNARLVLSDPWPHFQLHHAQYLPPNGTLGSALFDDSPNSPVLGMAVTKAQLKLQSSYMDLSYIPHAEEVEHRVIRI